MTKQEFLEIIVMLADAIQTVAKAANEKEAVKGKPIEPLIIEMAAFKRPEVKQEKPELPDIIKAISDIITEFPTVKPHLKKWLDDNGFKKVTAIEDQQTRQKCWDYLCQFLPEKKGGKNGIGF